MKYYTQGVFPEHNFPSDEGDKFQLFDGGRIWNLFQTKIDNCIRICRSRYYNSQSLLGISI